MFLKGSLVCWLGYVGGIGDVLASSCFAAVGCEIPTSAVIFEKVGITRLVTWLNPKTGKEEKRPINELASSHMARRTFIGNTYKVVRDPNIVASMSGYAEGSRAFSRYREIDREIKADAVNALD